MQTGSSVIGVQEVPTEQVSKYGIVDPVDQFRGSVCRIKALVEKPSPAAAPSRMAIMGRYIITPEIFFQILKHTKPGRNGEIQLTDVLCALLETQSIYACKFEGTRFDVGDKLGFLSATIGYALQREDLGEEFADYLAQVSLSKSLPVYGAIKREVKMRSGR